MKKHSIIYYSYILLFILLFSAILYFGRKLLIPIGLSALLAMLMVPIANWLEKKGSSRGVSSGLCVFILFLFLASFIFFLTYQVSNFGSNLPQLKTQLTQGLQQASNFLQQNFGINTKSFFSNLSSSISSYISNLASTLQTVLVGLFKTITGIIIVLVFVFLMLYYRNVFLTFIEKVSSRKEDAKSVSENVTKISYQYLGGRLIVIAIIAVINSVGLSLIGIKHAVFFGVLAAFLDLIPYIGIIIGAGLPLIFAAISKSAWWPFFAVLGLFVFVQLLENYFLTPKIVGSKVRLNPFFTIVAVLAGGYIWGIAGMILFIPFLAMAKILFDNVESLHPYGYLVGDPSNRTEKT